MEEKIQAPKFDKEDGTQAYLKPIPWKFIIKCTTIVFQPTTPH